MATEKTAAIRLDEGERAALAQRLTDDIALAAGDAEPYWASIRKGRRFLEAEQPRAHAPWPHASELVVPYVKQAKFALLAHMCPTLLGSDPLYHVEGTNAASKDTADDIEHFLHAQLTRTVKFRRVMERAFDAALRDGTAILHVYWKTEKRQLPVFAQAAQDGVDAQGRAVRRGAVALTRELATVYDAPKIDLIPVELFGTFPVANDDIQESPGVFVRINVTGEEILQHLAAGDYDADAVATLRELPGDTIANVSADSLARRINNSVTDQPFHARRYQLTQVYYRYAPGEDDDTPAEDWLITLHEESNTILQAIPSPWFHQARPFVALAPYAGVEGFYGDSLAAAGAGHVQTSLTTLLRLAVDAAAIGISPELLVAASLGADIAKIKNRRGPGGIIPFPDAYFENNSTKMQPFGSNGYHPSSIMGLYQLLDRQGQEATGVSDTLKGIPNPGNITATEAQQLLESSQKIIAFLTERFAAGMDELARLLQALNYQFQGNAGPQGLWTELHELRPAHAQAMTPEAQTAPPTLFAAMQGRYVISAGGVRDTNNRSIRAKRAMESIQMLLQDPLIAQNPERRYNLYADYLGAIGADAERFLGRIEEWKATGQQMQQMPQVQAQAQGQPAAPAHGGADAPGGGLEQALMMVAQALGQDPQQLAQQIAQQAQQTGQQPEAILAALVQQLHGQG